jgi:Fe-S-cluster containining protein
MQNFFNTGKVEGSSTPLNVQYDSLKDNYEQIFVEAAESIRSAISKFKPENPCKLCTVKNCNITKKDIFDDYPVGCAYKEWQAQTLSYLSGEYKQRLKNSHNAIMDKKSEYQCSRCGNCCRLATSEYSYEQLKQRAMRGDKFSKDFVSVFIPYANYEDAKNANPEYFKLLEDLMEDQKVYYYYCPKLVGNECSDYENRPSICKDFPHNPLKLLPSTCSFNEWKDSVSRESMLLKAKVDIIEFYKNKLG